jgi:hypothetical protein
MKSMIIHNLGGRWEERVTCMGTVHNTYNTVAYRPVSRQQPRNKQL